VAITAAVTARSVPAHHGWNGIYGRQKGALRCRLSPVRPRIRLCGNFVSAGQEHKRQPPSGGVSAGLNPAGDADQHRRRPGDVRCAHRARRAVRRAAGP